MSVHCNTPSALQSLYAESATAAAAFASQDDSPHNDLLPYDSSSDPSECPPGPAQAIARAGQPNSTYNCVCSYVTLTGLTLESAFLGCVLDILSDSIMDSSFSHPIPHSLLLYLYRHEFFLLSIHFHQPSIHLSSHYPVQTCVAQYYSVRLVATSLKQFTELPWIGVLSTKFPHEDSFEWL